MLAFLRRNDTNVDWRINYDQFHSFNRSKGNRKGRKNKYGRTDQCVSEIWREIEVDVP